MSLSEMAFAEEATDPRKGGQRKEQFTIHELVTEFEVTSRTLRFYEEKGLLIPTRRGQERIYSRRDRARLKLVLMGKSVGFSLEEVKSMLDLYDLGDGQATQLRVALERFEEKLAELDRRRRDIDHAYAELSHARDIVRGRLARQQK
ncbi:MerR family DNA-binding transcriptional regulator [Labrys sp. LIt4]|uniref:Transcriptional regulator n=1 Tax=Labrys okinawensis TaxID=346911 RepID=A0A2S9Q788_9HYPH|nr:MULTISPECIES: MerR family DNA-binding transcriptional regulator [Labrys]MBP0577740.1 MerR family DNA-binding transcriptional regulator [Labrys sp. LIt4]PRH85211.1 transcriptional regulator [Labrys okinawensis]